MYSSSACLQGWIQFQSDCYFLVQDNTKSWHNAAIDCLNRNSDLLYILSIEEDRFIDSKLINKSTVNEVFVGLFESGGNSNRFSLWSSGHSVNFTNWQKNTTDFNSNGTACVAKNKTSFGQWVVVNCSEMMPFICKRRGMLCNKRWIKKLTLQGML